MKKLEDMTLEEVVGYNVGREILAIGEGKFKDEVFSSAFRVLEWKRLQDEKKKPGKPGLASD